MSCFTCIKVLMVLFNLLIFLAGGTLLGVGIWVSVDSGSFLKIFLALSPDLASQIVNVGYFLIAIGSLLVILGFLGCCGAQKESKCLLIIFFTIVLIIFIAEIAGAVVALVYSSVAKSLLESVLVPVLSTQYGVNADVTKGWNSTMNEFHCCGLSGYGDFNNSQYVKDHAGNYPPQCCSNTTTSSNDPTSCTLTEAKTVAVKGCFDQILDLIKKYAGVVGGIAAGICALELAAMVVSMYLYCRIDKQGSIH